MIFNRQVHTFISGSELILKVESLTDDDIHLSVHNFGILLPTGSEEREVLRVGSYPVAILFLVNI